MRFWQRQQVIILVVTAAIIAGFLLLQYRPLQRKRRAVKQAQLDRLAAIAQAAARVEQLPQLQDEVRQSRSRVGSYEAKVPRSRRLGFFLQQIADLMNEHNLREQLVRPGPEIELKNRTCLAGLNCIPISLQCSGRLKRIFGFFKSLEQLERKIRIERMELTNDRDFAGDVSMQAKMNIYYRAGG